MAVIRNLVVKIGADIGSLVKGLKSAQQQLDKVSKQMSKVGASLTASFTVPFTTFATLAIKASSDIEDSMLSVEKSFNATGKEMETLTNIAKKMSANTVYSINEVADSMNYLKSAGYSVTQMEDSLVTLTNLATASEMELKNATADVVKVLSQFNLDTSETNKVANIMSATISKTSLTLDELTTALSIVGRTSTSVGYSIEETSAAIALLSNAGFNAEKSGSYLKSILTQLQSPTTEMTKVLNDLGISVDSINPKTHSLTEILETFADAGITSSQATSMFGDEIESAFMSLVSKGSDSLNEMTTSLTDTNSAEEEAEKKLGTLSNQLKIIKNQLNEISIQLGDVLLPILKDFLGNMVMPLIDKFSNLSDGTKELIIKISAIAAALGPVILTIAKLVKGISSLSGVFSALASPVGLIIAAIAAVIAIMVSLYNTNEEFRNKVNEIWGQIKDFICVVIEDIKAFWEQHGEAIKDAVVKAFEVIWNIVSSVFNAIAQGVSTLFSYIQPIWEQLKAVFSSLWNVMVELYELLKPIFEAIGAIVLTLFAVCSGVIEGIISALGPFIQAILDVFQIIIDVVGAIVSLFKGDFTGAFEHLQNIGTGFANFFSNLWQGILNFGKGFVDGFVNMFNNMGIDIVSILKNVWSAVSNFFVDLWHGISNTASNIWNAITGVFKDIGNWFGNLFKDAFNWGKNLINMIGDGIRSAVNWVTDACGSVIDTIKGWLGFGSPTEEGPGQYSDEWAPNFMDMYSKGIESGLPDIQDAVNQVALTLSSMNGNNYSSDVSAGETSIGGDILNGLLQALSMQDNKPTETDKPIELSIDGTVFARLIYPSLTKEFKRNGIKLSEGGFIQ